MSFQILLNIAIALVWMVLRNEFTLIEFFLGYLVGILALFILRRFLTFDFYLRRVYAFIKLVILFFQQLILSNIDMIKVVLKPKLDVQPGIFAFPTKLEAKWEITLLASLITLTPGTLSMYFSEDGKTIYIHAIDVPDKEEAMKDIQDTFEKAIMEVTK